MITDGPSAESSALAAVRPDDPGARRGLLLVLVLVAVLGVAFALRIPHGLPYDEPSYWNVTSFYAQFHRLPVLGHPGVSYEAQHPPLAFVFGAVGRNLGTLFGSAQNAGFTFTRVVGGIELLLAIVVLDRILRRTVPSVTGRVVALLVFAATPMMLAMSWSAQNDILSLLLGFVALELMLAREDHDGPGLRPTSGLLIGAVVGLAIVTKITVVFLVPTFLLWLALRARPHWRRVATTSAAFAAGVAAGCGWWFVRNLVVYGRLVASTKGDGGQAFHGTGFHGASTISAQAKELVTYLWVPTEYFRNLIHASSGLQAFLALVTVAVAVAAVWFATRGRLARRPLIPRPDTMSAAGSAWLLLLLLGGLSLAASEILEVKTGLAPRDAFIALPLWCSTVGYLVSRLVEHRSVVVKQGAIAASILLVVALDVWVLTSVSSLGPVAHSFL
jgi:Dolichyl-phosphate-mannose-protein mannosyltransferase